MLCLFLPLEEYARPFILTMVVLCFVFFGSFLLEFSSESACCPFVARDIYIVIRNSEFYRLYQCRSVLP
jgi:hypothetical protein